MALGNLSCSVLVSKHALSEARPELITSLDCHTYSSISHGRKKSQ